MEIPKQQLVNSHANTFRPFLKTTYNSADAYWFYQNANNCNIQKDAQLVSYFQKDFQCAIDQSTSYTVSHDAAVKSKNHVLPRLTPTFYSYIISDIYFYNKIQYAHIFESVVPLLFSTTSGDAAAPPPPTPTCL